MEHQEQIAVVCASYESFRRWCIDNERHHRDPALVPVYGLQDVRGRWFDQVVPAGGEIRLLTEARARLRSTRCADSAPA